MCLYHNEEYSMAITVCRLDLWNGLNQNTNMTQPKNNK